MTEKPKRTRSKEAAPSGSISIRELELEDIPAVFALGEKVFPADKWPNLYRTWDEYELVDLFLSDGDTCLVAELDDKVVGFALGTVIEKRRSAWNYGYLLWLGVDPDLGPRGIGSRLFTRIQELFISRGARMMLVDTAAGNHPALNFFHKQGFGDEQDHVYLSKNLDEEKENLEKRKAQRRRASRRPGGPARPISLHDEEDD